MAACEDLNQTAFLHELDTSDDLVGVCRRAVGTDSDGFKCFGRKWSASCRSYAAWNTGERRVPRQYCLMEGSLEGLLGSGTVVKEENCRLHCQGAEWSLEQVGMRKAPAHKILIIFYVDEKNEDVFVRSIKQCRGIHPRPSQCGFSSYCRQEPALLY